MKKTYKQKKKTFLIHLNVIIEEGQEISEFAIEQLTQDVEYSLTNTVGGEIIVQIPLWEEI